jgi:hypothetical protein
VIDAREPDFHWGGRPVYRCQLGCGDRFERVENLEAVLRHEEEAHASSRSVRMSSILGADGQPLQVVEENAL